MTAQELNVPAELIFASGIVGNISSDPMSCRVGPKQKCPLSRVVWVHFLTQILESDGCGSLWNTGLPVFQVLWAARSGVQRTAASTPRASAQ